MELHPLAQQFAAVADVYERGRPDYQPAVIGALAAELGLSPGDPVLDLGAGTGKLTRALVRHGFLVTAVEPQDSLRAVLAKQVPGARVLAGFAEEIPIADRTVAAVTVADAFHWFDRPKALAEIRRVLRPGGAFVHFNTVPDWRGASWSHDVGQLIVSARPEHPNFDGRPWHEYVREDGGFGEHRDVRVTTYAPADTERVADHMASISWIAAMSPDERAAFQEQVRALIAAGETPERFALHVDVGMAQLR